jgi:hypothetical protein
MTTWTRDHTVRRCGHCGQEIPIGDVFLLLSLNGKLLKKYRCQACAGPAPPDLPTVIEEAPPPPALDFTRIGLLPLDFSRREKQER